MTTLTKSNPHLVVKSNELINARMNGFSVAQIRLFEMLIAQLEKEQGEFQPQRIYLSDFVSGTGTKHKGEFDRAREITKSLMGQVIEIWDGDKLKQRNILYRADYDRKKPYVEIVFHPDLRPYLLQLKEKFTSYDVRNILALKKIHSIRLYQLLKQYLFTGTCTFEVGRLKYILGVENRYKKYNDFKKYTILAAQEELTAKCDITFDFEEIKKGRKIELLKFTVRRQSGKFGSQSIEEPEETAPESELFQILGSLGFTDEQSRHYLNTMEADDIQAAIDYTRKQFKAGRIKSNATAYLLKLLDSGFKESPAPGFAQARHQQKTRRKAYALQKEKHLIETLEAEFSTYRNVEVDKLVDEATEDDWVHFQAWAQQQLFVSAKIFSNGRFLQDHPDTLSYFRIFISDRLPERNQAFMEWSEAKGYPLILEAGSYWLRKEG